MLYKYFGFHEQPFAETPDPDFLYLSRSHSEALAFLDYQLMDGKGFSALIGEVGTGKTTLCQALRQRGNPSRTIVIHFGFPYRDLKDFLEETLDALGLSPVCLDKGVLLKAFKTRLEELGRQGQRVVFLLDEAHHLKPSVLEGLRMLSNLENGKEKRLHLIFVGQPLFLDLLNRPDLRPLRQRIAGTFHLGPLTRPETSQYIESRLNKVQKEPIVRFTPEAKDLIWRLSRGVPRLINFLCRDSLAQAFIADRLIVQEHFVQKAHQRLTFSFGGSTFALDREEEKSSKPRPNPLPVVFSPSGISGSKRTEPTPPKRTQNKRGLKSWAVAALLLLVIILDLFFLFNRQEKRPVTFSETYRQELVLPQETKVREGPKREKSHGGGSSEESPKPLAFRSSSMEDPRR